MAVVIPCALKSRLADCDGGRSRVTCSANPNAANCSYYGLAIIIHQPPAGGARWRIVVDAPSPLPRT